MTASEIDIEGIAWLTAPHHQPLLEGILRFVVSFTTPPRLIFYEGGKELGVLSLDEPQGDTLFDILDRGLHLSPSASVMDVVVAMTQAEH